MRKIGLFLLFLSVNTATSFAQVPGSTEKFTKNYRAPAINNYPINYQNASTQQFIYYAEPSVELAPVDDASLIKLDDGKALRPASSKKPNKLEYKGENEYPEASKDYQGNWYY